MPSTAAMRGATAMEAAAGAKAATMGAASKARLPARRKASGVSAVIKSAERAGVCSRLRMRR